MDRFEISPEDFAQLYHHVYIGKLFGGLIHNLNAPLHGLGMEIDMANHSLLKKKQPEDDLIRDISERLKKIDGEFENLNHQIRLAAGRADFIQYQPETLDINSFLNQEFEFMMANLYFKHNVRSVFKFESNLESIKDPSKHFLMALSWFIQRLVDELEDLRADTLIVETSMKESKHILGFKIKGKQFSKDFSETLGTNISSMNTLKIDGQNADLLLPIVLLNQNGVSIETFGKPEGAEIKIAI